MNTHEERDELRSTVSTFLHRYQDVAVVRDALDHGWDPGIWGRMTGELGLGAVGLPESHGGTGESLADLVVVTEELGRALDPGPFLPSVVVAARLLAELEGHDSLVTSLAAGARVATLIVATGRQGRPVARRHDATYRVSGRVDDVLHATTADTLLVLAELDVGEALFLCTPDAPGLTVHPLPVVDQTRPMADLEFEDVELELVAGVEETSRAVAVASRSARVAVAAELVGVAQGALDLTTAYAKQREQFGRAIGSFQAVKHRLVDVMVEIEASRTIVARAAAAVDEGSPDADELSHICKAVASDAALAAGKAAVQLHGAIGFTWEHDAHLYLKRAMSGAHLLGSARDHRQRLAAMILGDHEVATDAWTAAATTEGTRNA